MTIEEEILKKTKVNSKKLIEYGFEKENDIYKYSKNIMKDTFKIDIEINGSNTVKGKIIDLFSKDEYTNFRIEGSTGAFVGNIRNEFKTILKDIKNKCFVKEDFIFEQSNIIARYIKEKYGDEPEFKWERFPEYAIFRNSNNKKWYGIIMNINKNKLEIESDEKVEILDVKLNPMKIEELLKNEGFYPAYHMNKKNWITIILDNTILDRKIENLIDESYSYTLTNKMHE